MPRINRSTVGNRIGPNRPVLGPITNVNFIPNIEVISKGSILANKRWDKLKTLLKLYKIEVSKLVFP